MFRLVGFPLLRSSSLVLHRVVSSQLVRLRVPRQAPRRRPVRPNGQSLVQPRAVRRPLVRFVHDPPGISPPYSAAWAHATIRRNPAPPPGRLAPGPGVVSRLRAVAPQDHVVDAHIAARTFPEAALAVPAQPDGEPVTHARTNTAIPVARLLAGLRGADGREDAVNARYDESLGTLDGGEERLLAGLGEDALAGIRDEASGDDVRIAGSDRGHEAARGSRVGGVWDCRRVVPKHRTRPVGKNIKSGRERRDVVEKRDGNSRSKMINSSPAKSLTCIFVPSPNVDRDLSPLWREESSKRGERTDESKNSRRKE